MALSRTAQPKSFRRVRWLFLRGLGLVYLVAFASLRRQALGLYGERGILPIRRFLHVARALPRARRLWLVPSVFWYGASDRAIVRACRVGEIAAAALALNVAPRAAAFVAWLTYLSFVATGQDFLSYQWDSLLLESGAHAVLLAPPLLIKSGLRPGLGADEVPIELALALRWLAFRLHFGSGIAKLRSGDVTWRGGTACAYHHETQPLPTPVGWRAHHLPRAVLRAATYGVLVAECAVPLVAFAPRRLRRAGFAILEALQITIELTGNYGFFNALSAALLLFYLDDADLPLAGPERRRARPRSRASRALSLLMLGPVAVVSVAKLVTRLFAPITRGPLRAVARAIEPFHLASAYGLFSAMTTGRPEIVLEASMDGRTWREYRMKYKPGDVTRAPPWVAPHMPRLDWQMWFAALGSPSPWLASLVVRLLEAQPEVLALFESAPFGSAPPRYVRATLYAYWIADRATREETGAYWAREEIGPVLPPVALAREPAAAAANERVTEQRT